MSSAAERSLLIGSQIGRNIFDPINSYLDEKTKMQFEKEMYQQKLADAWKQLIATNPDIASGLVGKPTEYQNQGQTVVEPLSLTNAQASDYANGIPTDNSGYLNTPGGTLDLPAIRQSGLDKTLRDLDTYRQKAAIEAQYRKPAAKSLYVDPVTQKPLVFDPETSTFTEGKLPEGINGIGKLGGGKGSGSLTEYQKLTLINKAAKAGIDVGAFTNQDTGEVNWNGISEAAGQSNAGGQTQEAYLEDKQERIADTAKNLLGQVSGWNTGMGSLLSYIPGTGAADFEAAVDSLKANVAFKELAEMRAASKTGGALGQVSDRELNLLSAARGSLNTRQSPGAFKKTLQTIVDSVQRWEDAKSKLGTGQTSTTKEPSNQGSPQFKIGERVTQKGKTYEWDGKQMNEVQ